MKIDRSKLLEEMHTFFQQESGVVIGEPGVGKTYLLSKMVSLLLEKKIPATMVQIDFLSDGSDKDIAEALGVSGENWIDALRLISLPDNTKGIFIFDAYDTIKDEKLKTVILKQITKAKQQLPNWSIVVSVRTYDAIRSQKLIELFPAEFNNDNIHCRRFKIPILSEKELSEFLTGYQKLNTIYKEGTAKLKEIFRIPFFLSLLDIILSKTDTSTDTIRVLKSEIELLQMYWIKVVYKVTPSIQMELFLKDFTLKMVENRVISVDKLDYLSNIDIDKLLITEQLLGENILTEQGSYSPKMAFAHNILFDFAVSKLVLKDNTIELLQFIAADQARPFFLRPSFIYFFANLWYVNPAKFWTIYNELSLSTDDVISLFNKLIPSTIVAKEFVDTNQLKFLDDPTSYNISQTINVLQALRFIKETTNKAAQASLLLRLSTNLQLAFVWDFSFILEGLIKDPIIQADVATFSICGNSARNLINFLLANKVNQSVDQLASYTGISLIAKTYSTDIEASRTCLQLILDIIDQPDFNIAYVSTLTENIKEFYMIDPQFCARIYEKVSAHEENSFDQAPMYSGVLMSFTSSRHDQFDICHYRLQQIFPKFISSSPELAIPIALSISNNFIKKKNLDGLVILDTIKIPFDFLVDDINAHYQVDLSHSWYHPMSSTEPIQYTQYILNYFEKLISTNEIELLKILLKSYFSCANSAYNWKMLLDFGTSYPEILHDLLFNLLLQPAILYCDDTIVAAGTFLESAIQFYTKEQVHQLEKTILAYPENISVSALGNMNILRLLSRIPKERLTEAKSIAIMSSSEVMKNEPLVSYTSTSEIYTTEMFLTEQGVDIKKQENEQLLAENQKMEWLTNHFSNDVPDAENYAEPLKAANKTFVIVRDNTEVSQRLKQTILTNVADVCRIVLHSNLTLKHEVQLSPEQYITFKEMLFFCLNYYTDSDIFAEKNSSPGSIYSQTPRSNAAFALPKLFACTKDVDLLPLIKQYANDKNAITRFGIMQSLHHLYPTQKELFWEIVNERLDKETDWFTKSVIIGRLNNVKIFTTEPDRFINAYQLAKSEIFKIPEGHYSYLASFLSIALAFLRFTGDVRIKDILRQCLENNLSIGPVLVSNAFEIIKPENRNYLDPTDVEKSVRVLDTLMMLLNMCEKMLLSTKSNDEVIEEVQQSFVIIDTVIKQIYFSMQVSQVIPQQNTIRINQEHQLRFYFFAKPLLEKILGISRQLKGGHMQGHSAHYFIEIMGEVLRFDARFSLATTSEITTMAVGTNYTFDYSAIQEVVKYTERLLADHKSMLTEPQAFAQIMNLLNIYVRSGWPVALDLLWKLDEIFR
ncbi:NACHT domain-containing protein [Arcicella lustrica]|uniref:AAA+ ATPase domain-containing protein n=1 Tax=Arcicella lustrica TaxID=2984196 RepID=A0ABU5SDS6_9BACT|nr:hypothetical protein [Arcicella sp. DC25W]MEA5425406.1 hypothetical protein [Arcicella sp. DC25W]